MVADGTDIYNATALIRCGSEWNSGLQIPYPLISYFKRVQQLSNGRDERLRITSAGKLLVGDDTARGFDGGNTPQLQVASNTSGEWARMSSATYIDSTIGGGLILAHSRNGTVGSHTVVQDDDKLGSYFL